MSTWNSDEVEGKLDQAKGSVKSTIGEITGDRETEAEGDAEHAAGKTQETWGKVKRGVGDAVEDIGDALSGADDKVSKA